MNALVPMNEIQAMAAAIAKSGLFGVKTTDQALSLMLIAQAEGRHPALAARDYDIIQGRPAKKTEAMLRDFLEQEGKVEWHKLDDTIADATFSHPAGGSVRIVWDLKRAAAAGLASRDMWKKYPRPMLRSRVVSEGIRTVCPMATSGMYVPEEIRDMRPEKDITPSSGVEDRLAQEQIERVKEIAQVMHTHIADGDFGSALSYMQVERAVPLDADEQVYLWTHFDSKQRSAMKREQAARRALPAPDQRAAAAAPDQDSSEPSSSPDSAADGSPSYITPYQALKLEAMCIERNCVDAFKQRAEVERFAQVLAADFDGAKKWISKQASA